MRVQEKIVKRWFDNAEHSSRRVVSYSSIFSFIRTNKKFLSRFFMTNILLLEFPQVVFHTFVLKDSPAVKITRFSFQYHFFTVPILKCFYIIKVHIVRNFALIV